MNQRHGFIGIVIEDPAKAPEINNILSRHGQIIAGRMGIPRIHHNEAGISVITLIAPSPPAAARHCSRWSRPCSIPK